MADVKLPDVEMGSNDAQTLANLYDAYYKLKRTVEYQLANLDSTNVRAIDADSVRVTNLTAGAIKTGELIVGDTVGQGTAPRSFTSTPTTPYNIGDIWTGGLAGDMKRCTTARASGAYNALDWTLATKYTDDSGVTTIIGDTVTTTFMIARQVAAYSVSCESLTGTTITGKTISGGTIDGGEFNMYTTGSTGKIKIFNDGAVAKINLTNASDTVKGQLSYVVATDEVSLAAVSGTLYLASTHDLYLGAVGTMTITAGTLNISGYIKAGTGGTKTISYINATADGIVVWFTDGTNKSILWD